jgi:hypothetical protein
MKTVEEIYAKKSEEDIVDRLMDDTIQGKLNWYKDEEYIYCSVRTEKGTDIVDTIFRIWEESYMNEFTGYVGYDIEDEDDEYFIILDIYMKKNKKGKEIFIWRIKNYQLKLTELLNVVLRISKPKPKPKSK